MAHNDFNNFQFGEPNLRWLSLLPLFETEHWPMEAVEGNDPWLVTCICWRDEHHTVTLFPYARYTQRGAWYQMEDTISELYHHYGYHGRYEEYEDSLVETCRSWPDFFSRIFLQDATNPSDGWCLNTEDPCTDTPWAYLYFDQMPDGYDYCNCTLPVPVEEAPAPVEEAPAPVVEPEIVEDVSDWNTPSTLGWGEFPVTNDDGLVFEDGSTMNIPHLHIESVAPFKGFRVGVWEPWEFQVTGESEEMDSPPSYSSVSELPSYEEAVNPPRYESVFW